MVILRRRYAQRYTKTDGISVYVGSPPNYREGCGTPRFGEPGINHYVVFSVPLLFIVTVALEKLLKSPYRDASQSDGGNQDSTNLPLGQLTDVQVKQGRRP